MGNKSVVLSKEEAERIKAELQKASAEDLLWLYRRGQDEWTPVSWMGEASMVSLVEREILRRMEH